MTRNGGLACLCAHSQLQASSGLGDFCGEVRFRQEPRLLTDWNQVWKDLMGKRQGVAPDCADLWDTEKHARHYWETIQQLGQKRIMKTISGLHLRPDSRVLDIGAGPGTLVECGKPSLSDPFGGILIRLPGGCDFLLTGRSPFDTQMPIR